ncbi:hypothetical protein FGIG_04401 [Fasciola gigantica]|uniref:Uncharacterized protein n=1 Tax=Fasciola gigantica TaxID=46835 RepID=A0A504YQ08_FASGI|nr:hypothetical protein FGIG_04401 [Fasciola gigantica]
MSTQLKRSSILDAAVIDQTSSNLLAVKLDQLVKLNCSADANPVAHISLYRLGEAGNQMLHRLSELHSGPNQSFTISQRQDSVQSTSVLLSELSLRQLEYAIKTEGSQVNKATGVSRIPVIQLTQVFLAVIFVIGSSAATGLAVIFVVTIGCLIRYSRTHSTQSTDSKNSAVKLTFIKVQLEITSVPCFNYFLQPMCHFCLAAQNPAFLDTQIEVDDVLGSGTAVNCKKSDDSGCELGDVTSISPGPNDATFREKTTAVCQEFQPLLNTIFLQNPPVVGYPSNKAQCDTVRNNSKYGKTFFNAYAGTDVDPSTNLTSSQQRSVQMQPMCDQSANIMYDSIHGSSTFERPLLTNPLSPILVVTPTLAQSDVYDNSILPTSLFIPQVVFSSPNGLITSPVKSSCFTSRLQSRSLRSIVPNDSSSLLRNAPDIYPDLSVSPLKFSDDKPGFSASSSSSNAILVCSVGHTKNDHQSSSETRPGSQLTEVFTSRNCSDDNGTNI